MTTKPSNPSDQSPMLESATHRFLTEGQEAKVGVELSQETRKELMHLASTHGVDEDEALRMALAAGLRFFAAEQALRVSSAIGGRAPEELERLLTLHIELEADYAVLKHRLWLALQDNQAMSLREGALTATIAGLKGLVERLRAELAGLNERSQATASEQARHPSQAAPASSPRSQGNWRHLLRRVFHRNAH